MIKKDVERINSSIPVDLNMEELEERLEMTMIEAPGDGGGDHSCSSMDCIQHDNDTTIPKTN